MSEDMKVFLFFGGPIILTFVIVGVLMLLYPPHKDGCLCERCIEEDPSKRIKAAEKRAGHKIYGHGLRCSSHPKCNYGGYVQDDYGMEG